MAFTHGTRANCKVPAIERNFIWNSKRLTDLHNQCKMSRMIDLMGVFRKIKVLSLVLFEMENVVLYYGDMIIPQ